MKDTYNYETKRKARIALKEFIERFYTKPSRRKELRVLTLLGHEPYELEQVWDPLGVPRENILCIESKRKIYDYIRKQNRGVRMLDTPTSLESYVAETRETFDVINIDGVSPFGFEQRQVLRRIAGKGTLGEKGVLATWYLGARENGYHQEWFHTMFEKYSDQSKFDKRKIKDRSDLLSRMVCAIFIDGVLNKGVIHPYADPKTYPRTYDELKKTKIPQEVEEEFSKLRHYNMQTGMIHKKSEGDLTVYHSTHFIEEKLLERIKQALGEEGPSFLLGRLFYYKPLRSYFSIDQRRLQYIGDRGSTMLVDLNYFKREQIPDAYVEIKENSLEELTFQKILRPITKETEKFIYKFKTWLFRCWGETLAPREHFGSSYGENVEREIVSSNSPYHEEDSSEEGPALMKAQKSLPEVPEHIKEEIRQLARDGFTADEIWEDYEDKGIFESRRQFGSILAWGHDSFKEKRKNQSNYGTENDATP